MTSITPITTSHSPTQPSTGKAFRIRSISDVTHLINTHGNNNRYARMIVLLALGGVFLDAYDLTTLSYGIDDVVKEFALSPVLTGVVTSSITIGTILGNIVGGWMTDKYGRYSVFMADMLFFVVSAIAAGLAPNVWVLIGARFLMGVGIGIDLPVAMAYLAEFSKFTGKGNKGSRLAAWCPMWYAASSACFLIVFIFYLILPTAYEDWIWRVSLLFGAVPALAIVAVRSRFMRESPQWAANQGDLEGAARILREAYGIDAVAEETAHNHPHDHESASQAIDSPNVSITNSNVSNINASNINASNINYKNRVDLRAILRPPYRQITLVSGLMGVCISFEYTAIAFFLPTILQHFLGASVFQTISASLGLNALFAFTGGLLGMRLAWKYPSRHVLIVGFILQFISLIALALLGHPDALWGIGLAILMLGLWLFAEGFGPGAQEMVYPTLAFPSAIRASGVGFARACAGVGGALALFILPILQHAYGDNMFWIIAVAPVLPVIALLIVRVEPTQRDVDLDDQTTTP